MEEKQEIYCSVHDCNYCDCSCDKCTLKDIKVSNCDGDGTKENTMCSSYEKR